MPYPRYSSYSARSSVNPWDGGAGMGGMMPNNSIALVNNLVGALMQQQTIGQVGMMPHHHRDDRRRFGRSRSPMRRGGRGGRSRSRDRRRRNSPQRRRRSPPADRAEHEIYIGNYPVGYREEELKNLFSEFLIDVGKIRMKSDGHKVFAFAETVSMEMVERAVNVMDGKEIKGRRLRVRGSKDTDKKRREGGAEEGKGRKKKEPRIPKLEDCKKHLVTAFIAFIERELTKESEGENEDFKGLLEAAKTALTAAYNLPEDQTFAVSREIEDIFFRAARLDIKLPEEPEDEEAQEVKPDQENGEAGQGSSQEEKDTAEMEVLDSVEGDEDEEDEGKMMEDLENVLAEEDDTVEDQEEEQEEQNEEEEPEQKEVSGRGRGRGKRGRRGNN